MEIIYPAPIENITPVYENYAEIKDAYNEAKKYMNSFRWCTKINDAVLYYNLLDKLSIFLFDIDNSSSSKDNLLWVVVGDLPSMYLDTYGAESVKGVLENYADLASDWVNCVLKGESVEECYPFLAEPTKEYADLLQKRADFINNVLLDEVDDVPLKK